MYGHGMVHGPGTRHFLASVTLERSLEQSLAWVTFWNGTPCGILWNTLWNTPRDTLREHDVSRPFVTAMKDWLCFLGYYMAAGGIEKKDDSFTRVTFNASLMSPGAPERLESYIRRIGFEPEVVENEIVVKSTQLATHVAWCGWTRDLIRYYFSSLPTPLFRPIFVRLPVLPTTATFDLPARRRHR